MVIIIEIILKLIISGIGLFFYIGINIIITGVKVNGNTFPFIFFFFFLGLFFIFNLYMAVGIKDLSRFLALFNL